jgi:hypothetical protein
MRHPAALRHEKPGKERSYGAAEFRLPKALVGVAAGDAPVLTTGVFD